MVITVEVNDLADMELFSGTKKARGPPRSGMWIRKSSRVMEGFEIQRRL